MTLHALLADSDRVPLSLGTSGVFDRFKLHIHLQEGAAFFES